MSGSRTCARLGLSVGDGDRVSRRCPDGQRCTCWEQEAHDSGMLYRAKPGEPWQPKRNDDCDGLAAGIAVELRARPSNQPCAECDGTGRALVSRAFLGDDPQEDDCFFCNGTGYQLVPIGQEAS